MKFITKNKRETQKLARHLSGEFLKRSNPKKALVIALSGNLGAGKTTFAQWFAKPLGVKESVKSPTFVLMQIFKTGRTLPNGKRRLVHIDTYRIKRPSDMLRIGLKDILKDPKNIILIEWAEKIKGLLPKDGTWIYFKHAGRNRRIIIVSMTPHQILKSA
ncbi:MAG: tRNA (adenosine(37)-N6)-threonylcarbamoyltransferase complex ATPase subunit type 1 TsaE [Candidatus Sungbacteria bacterium RIFCSPLOWO2_02_FULL_47_9]|uniref:tRNA threonylcarbamoyladenosine biosynthesis protein TsaE n=1 Tax=Candidatus Sungbacteria bacterium RIFCSPHIGHO2_01_FULL_47_32 TaxID=1802264 RepID=A0A1G2K451_9BACT|nr:MAG: tRNA (adenosine(37)-N6)-threonylcarbamoyltransferase complex ATPase subunit type 1 TsaE [Candidatus Sungbacteria bacterium RIFCSPHIGHO2_01_FULL_47_32]OGZ98647.1 MAG: tRNA (adenosine(37)-N6)-threonylcarbamoyltransferase complex ATPase subunit type 1 TsaE [Candidatus Sungbacteria bacterium RIFCSPHIGHO2_02_FULL_46_12]OHA06271.1 MAG: tRNA (adenosine(37)-N6)-threonylcarbamoyltransferase complex ATPase subunit type 1 TsaE [Candidatus Sungbacteria bacterium RIFCSPLOWO2_01_FULL_47_32]OHA09768.1 